MTTLRDYRDFVDNEPLVLPINGKHYTVPEPNAQEGIYLSTLHEKITALGKKGADPDLVMFTDEGEADLYKRSLGTLYDQLVEDNVPFAALRLAGMVAFVDFTQGRAHAIALWEAWGGGAAGEAPSPNRAARRASTKTRSGKTGAAANTTKKPASGSGTKSRPKSSPTSEPEPTD